jgi:metallo-beta-lactamase family protein
MKITFLGGVGTVTGSKYLVEAGDTRLLVDCGLFQGVKTLRQRNRRPFPVDPASIDGIVLTHAHLDHSGFLPILVRDGFRGKIHCTAPTVDLVEILLADSAHLQEEDARYANKKSFSRHSPATPLYTREDAQRVGPRLVGHEFDDTIEVGDVSLRFSVAGHILGAAHVGVTHRGEELLFSGDIGRRVEKLMPRPTPPRTPRWVVMESTYGDRHHPDTDMEDALAEVLVRTIERKGVVLIPAFAVGRTQLVLYLLDELHRKKRVPRTEVWVNSPMATDVTGLYERFHTYHSLSRRGSERIFGHARFARTVEESKALNEREGPIVIISASGMLTGGRVLHHLAAYGSDPKNTILLPGYQAAGTRGAQLVEGRRKIKLHGRYVDVRAEVVQLDMMSAHADQSGLIEWLEAIERPPSGVFLVHGEPVAADMLRREIDERLGFPVEVPEDGEVVELR